MESLRRAQDAERVKQATGLIKRRIVDIVLDYAEKGDSQLCATVCCVLQHHDMGFDQSFVLRVTKAYLGTLLPVCPNSSTDGVIRSSPSSPNVRSGCGHAQGVCTRLASIESAEQCRLSRRLW